jgi:hypothetical protein
VAGLFDYEPPRAPSASKSRRDNPKPVCPFPFLDNGDHRCAVCGSRPAPFGVGSTRKLEKLKFYCQEHRP